MKKLLFASVLLLGCAKKKSQDLEDIYAPPVIDFPEDDELDDLPESNKEDKN